MALQNMPAVHRQPEQAETTCSSPQHARHQPHIWLLTYACAPSTRGTRVEYRLVAKKGEGTFSEVLKAQCVKSGRYVAIKCMKNKFDSLDQARGGK
jgi:serine/threonine protein kinase